MQSICMQRSPNKIGMATFESRRYASQFCVFNGRPQYLASLRGISNLSSVVNERKLARIDNLYMLSDPYTALDE